MADEKILKKETSGALAAIGDTSKLKEKLGKMRPEDAAELIEKAEEEERTNLFLALTPEASSEVLLLVNEETREGIIAKMSIDDISEVVEEMDSDDAADFVAELPEKDADKVLDVLPEDDAEEVRELLRYPEESAGGIMQLELVSLHEDQTCQDAIEIIRSKSDEVEELHFVFVTNGENRLVGKVPLRKLILHSPDTPIRKIMEKDPISINVMEDEEKVALAFRKYDMVSAPVVDEEGRLLGRILHDDVLDVITEIDTEDMLKVAGTDEDELESHSWMTAARHRLPWLLSSMLGGVLMAGIISAMGAPLKQVIALASFIPVITGMSGNVSTQSSAIVVRSLALGKIDTSTVGRLIYKEVWVSLAMAALCGVLMGIVAQAINENPVIGMIVGLSLLCSMLFASLLGTYIPLLLNKLEADPALGAGPIVLTLVDITALFIYFTVASVLLRTAA